VVWANNCVYGVSLLVIVCLVGAVCVCVVYVKCVRVLCFCVCLVWCVYVCSACVWYVVCSVCECLF